MRASATGMEIASIGASAKLPPSSSGIAGSSQAITSSAGSRVRREKVRPDALSWIPDTAALSLATRAWRASRDEPSQRRRGSAPAGVTPPSPPASAPTALATPTPAAASSAPPSAPAPAAPSAPASVAAPSASASVAAPSAPAPVAASSAPPVTPVSAGRPALPEPSSSHDRPPPPLIGSARFQSPGWSPSSCPGDPVEPLSSAPLCEPSVQSVELCHGSEPEPPDDSASAGPASSQGGFACPDSGSWPAPLSGVVSSVLAASPPG